MFPLLYEYLQNRGLKVVRVVSPMVTEWKKFAQKKPEQQWQAAINETGNM